MLLPGGRWYSSFVWQMLLPIMWQMFLPLQCIAPIDRLMLLPGGRWNSHLLLIDCKFFGQMLLPCGRWNSQLCLLWWLMLLPSGRWNSHCRVWVVPFWWMLFPGGQMVWVFILIWVQRCYAEPHPIYEADGTCLCSCLGMDYLPLYIMLLWSISRGSGPPSPQC